MIEYASKYYDKLFEALLEHIQLVAIALIFSLIIASVFTICASCVPKLRAILVQLFSAIYSIPSLALFALLIPLTGLGEGTALIVLVIYNQYLLLRNFITGLNEVDPAVIEAAVGLGMGRVRLLRKIQLPLAKRAIFTGIKLAVVSTVGIATIAALINAGGLGTLMFDGLRTMNVDKIVWGSILSAGLAIGLGGLLNLVETIMPPTGKVDDRGIQQAGKDKDNIAGNHDIN
jgi:osmoprotectant transport system permease protein